MQARLVFALVVVGVGATATAGAEPSRDASEAAAALDLPATPSLPATVRVTLTRQSGVSGTQRVNFAVPIAKGLLTDGSWVRVRRAGGAELRAARRVLAKWPDGSVRSVQIQVDVDPASVPSLDVDVGTTPRAGSLTMASVSSTLLRSDGTTGPRVWAKLPSTWLATSGVVGPIQLADAIAGTALDAWGLCDYGRFGVDAFLARQSDKGSWLYDRPTALYRGYAFAGDGSAMRSAYREAAIYRSKITGTGSSTRIGVPGSSGDLKYHYTQGMAIHYLLTGDDRFREAAENVAIRVNGLWRDPRYDGGFWTERHAGFALLAYEWAAAVSDDRASTFAAWADQAVTAYLDMQDASRSWESDAKCFAHSADAHGEDYGTTGCSPWMSAILADGLDAYARRAGGTRATRARAGIVKLGKMLARHGRDREGKPYYWLGIRTSSEVDGYDEHWGESAYVIAMAWAMSGKSDDGLLDAALELVEGLRDHGSAGQLRSFNWQCRSAVATPYFLTP